MVVQPLARLAVCGVQVVTPTGPVTMLPQVVATNKFPALGATVVHDPTTVGPVNIVGPTQVVVVYALPAFAPDGVQDKTGTFEVEIGAGQVIVVQLLPTSAADAVHVATGTLVVVSGAGQVVVVKALPELATAAVQLATGTLVVTVGAGQLVAV